MFDDREFLEVARHLQYGDPREGFQRSAISRAYYSAFLLARTICRDRGWLPQRGTGADHRAIPGALSRLDAKLGAEFEELRRLRTDADYSTVSEHPDRLAEKVQLAIDLAGFIRRELKRIT